MLKILLSDILRTVLFTKRIDQGRFCLAGDGIPPPIPLQFIASTCIAQNACTARLRTSVPRKLACSVLANKLLEPAPERVLAKTILATVFADSEFASAPRLDVKRPPLTPGFVLEVFQPPGNCPRQQRTRNETRTHYRRVVQRPDGYSRPNDGKIKGLAPRDAKAPFGAWLMGAVVRSACRDRGKSQSLQTK